MKVLILANFVDKFTGLSYREGQKAKFEKERAKALSKLGYAKLLETEVKEVETEKAVKAEKVEKAVKAEKTEKKTKKK